MARDGSRWTIRRSRCDCRRRLPTPASIRGPVRLHQLDQLQVLMHPLTLQAEALGRYYVVVSLLEAETLRALLHAKAGGPLRVSLRRLCHSAPSPTRRQRRHVSRVDRTPAHGGRRASGAAGSDDDGGCQARGRVWPAVRVLRRRQSDGVHIRAAYALLRSIQNSSVNQRQAFFAAVCASRRRIQHGWNQRPSTRCSPSSTSSACCVSSRSCFSSARCSPPGLPSSTPSAPSAPLRTG